MLAAGDVIGGRFRLIRPIGNGGTSSVWWARHELIERDVALKLTPTAGGSPETRQRFLREARIVGKFQHRNIVAVLDAGELLEPAHLFLAMELLRGTPLSDRFLPDQPIPADEIVPILIEVCRGLEVAHAAGVVHRDIKPENVFLAETTGGVVPKIVDFGISQSESDGRQALTVDNQVLGTPNYMSPEQAVGLRRVDARSDVWAIGVMLYEALTGTQPFCAATHYATLRRIVDEEPAPLPDAIDARLRAVVARCLEKDPLRRYPDATTVREALESAVGTAPERVAMTGTAGARGDAATYRIVSARRRAAVTRRHALTATLAALALVFLAAFVPGRDPRPPEDEPGAITPPHQPVAVEAAGLTTPPAPEPVVDAELAPTRRLERPAVAEVRRPAQRPVSRVTTPGF